MRPRILTLNVWSTEGDPRRPQIINRRILQLEPDLIALQEVMHTAKAKALDALARRSVSWSTWKSASRAS